MSAAALLIALAGQTGGEVAVVVREPVPPAYLARPVEAACGLTRIMVEQTMFWRSPREVPVAVAVHVNGEAVTGALARRIAADLGDPRRVYRYSVQCASDRPNTGQLIVHSGGSDADGAMRFMSARIEFDRSGVTGY